MKNLLRATVFAVVLGGTSVFAFNTIETKDCVCKSETCQESCKKSCKKSCEGDCETECKSACEEKCKH